MLQTSSAILEHRNSMRLRAAGVQERLASPEADCTRDLIDKELNETFQTARVVTVPSEDALYSSPQLEASTPDPPQGAQRRMDFNSWSNAKFLGFSTCACTQVLKPHPFCIKLGIIFFQSRVL